MAIERMSFAEPSGRHPVDRANATGVKMRSLSERLRAFEQRKAKLAHVEAKLKLAEKRSHLRQCIKVGDLAMRAGLGMLEEECLYGAFLSIARENETKRRQWSAEGVRALAAQKPDVVGDRQPVVVTFAKPPDPETTAALRAGGFRFNRLLRHWEGLALLEEAVTLAESRGGVARAIVL